MTIYVISDSIDYEIATEVRPMTKILITEDDETIRTALAVILSDNGLCPITASSCEQALQLFDECDLCLLDLMLPGGSGLDVLKQIRSKSNMPVMIISCMDDNSDIAKGLDMGADDYVTKPFSGQVLVSRINALLRRSGGFANDMPDGLTASEQRLYSYFTLNKGRVLTRDQLLAHMWDSKGEYVSDNTLSVAVNRIRSKLAGHGRIVTVKGVGYKWEDL
ncbi:MAG: response regulator transcription factor [Ruminococcus sp.]|nr:response regulator transcription factor [Ruminococcus sp.]